MVVTKARFREVLETLKKEPCLALDTETYGLRMYHGETIFSIILSTETPHYFNFKNYDDVSDDCVLGSEELDSLNKELFSDPLKTWYIAKAANFDLPHLGQRGLEIEGAIHCVVAIGRVVFNDRRQLGLEAQLPDIGLVKDSTVEDYISKNKLFTLKDIPGKKQRDKQKHYDKVPFDLIVPYGCSDATSTYKLGKYQEEVIKKTDLEYEAFTKSGRSLKNVYENEKRLVKTIYRMKTHGVQIDRGYCAKAIRYEEDRAEKAREEFKKLTGETYASSSKLFEKVFESERGAWSYTEKGNPSFDSDALARLQSDAAKQILKLRDAKSRSDFYHGFLHHSDSKGVLHPNFNSEGTTHGRFSSSEPNFQNLTAEAVAECKACGEEIETLEKECPKCKSQDLNHFEFTVRRAIIPRPGYVLIMPDYDQMEYKFALEMACKVADKLTDLGAKVKAGFDFHDATGDEVFHRSGHRYPRKIIKVANFLTLYGGGPSVMAKNLGVTVPEAKKIQNSIRSSIPEINAYIQTIIKIAEQRGFIVNWFGRRCHFTDRNFTYKAPNYHVSGGCADVVKLAMNRIDEYLLSEGKKSKLVMTVHDELPMEIHESEIDTVPRKVKEIMESVYKSQYIPLTTGMEFSLKSLGDKIKGYPK